MILKATCFLVNTGTHKCMAKKFGGNHFRGLRLFAGLCSVFRWYFSRFLQKVITKFYRRVERWFAPFFQSDKFCSSQSLLYFVALSQNFRKFTGPKLLPVLMDWFYCFFCSLSIFFLFKIHSSAFYDPFHGKTFTFYGFKLHGIIVIRYCVTLSTKTLQVPNWQLDFSHLLKLSWHKNPRCSFLSTFMFVRTKIIDVERF